MSDYVWKEPVWQTIHEWAAAEEKATAVVNVNLAIEAAVAEALKTEREKLDGWQQTLMRLCETEGGEAPHEAQDCARHIGICLDQQRARADAAEANEEVLNGELDAVLNDPKGAYRNQRDSYKAQIASWEAKVRELKEDAESLRSRASAANRRVNELIAGGVKVEARVRELEAEVRRLRDGRDAEIPS